MFEALRIRIHRVISKVMSRRPSRNQDAPVTLLKPHKIDPYITDYSAKRTKTFGEWIDETVWKKKVDNADLLRQRVGGAPSTQAESGPAPIETRGPSFFDDYKRTIEADILFVASNLRAPRWNRHPKTMTEDQIATACANIRW